MADNYDEHVHNATGAGGRYLTKRSFEVSAGVYADAVVVVDSAGVEVVPPTAGLIGALTETAPATDTASSGLNGRLQRIAQRLTSLIALLPASLGVKAAAASLSVTQSTEDAVVAAATNTKLDTVIAHVAPTTGLGDGVTVVTTAGTDVALAGSTACKWVMIQSQTDNTSKIAVGVTGVDATIATGDGILLDPGDAITLPIDNLADVFIDSLVNGEGVRYIYGT